MPLFMRVNKRLRPTPAADYLAQVGRRLLADMAPVDSVMGDPGAVRDAIACLLDNAFKWTKGRVEVEIKLIEDNSGDGRMWFDLSVMDDGPGLPDDKRNEALQRGHRLDETKPGSGLGLSIVSETAGM